MRRSNFVRFAGPALCPLMLVVAPALCLAAPPPPLLRITSDRVLPGRQALHARILAEQSRYLRTVQWPTVYIALRPVTGPGDVLVLTGYPALAGWDRDRSSIENNPSLKTRLEQFAARTGELVSERREISADFQSEISYRPEFEWSKLRYLDVITILLRPGHGDEYLENRKIVVEAHTKAGVEEHMWIYQVSSGRRGTTFLILRPVESFEALDLEKAHGDRYLKILGAANRKRLHELFAASDDTQEEEFYAVDPAMSYVTPAWAGAQKNFWFVVR